MIFFFNIKTKFFNINFIKVEEYDMKSHELLGNTNI